MGMGGRRRKTIWALRRRPLKSSWISWKVIHHLVRSRNLVVLCLLSGRHLQDDEIWSTDAAQWRSQGGGAVGAAAPLAGNPELHCILLLHNFTVHGTPTRNCIVIEPHTHSKQRLLFYYAKARSIRSIVGKWNIWVMRCVSFTSGNTQTPNWWFHTPETTHKNNMIWVKSNNRLRA